MLQIKGVCPVCNRAKKGMFTMKTATNQRTHACMHAQTRILVNVSYAVSSDYCVYYVSGIQ